MSRLIAHQPFKLFVFSYNQRQYLLRIFIFGVSTNPSLYHSQDEVKPNKQTSLLHVHEHMFNILESIKRVPQLENWHSQRGPRCRACHYDLDLWPFHPKIYRCLPFFILHLCMKYEVCRSNTVRVIALQRSVDRRTDRQTDGQTDSQSDYYRAPASSMAGP